MAKALGRTTVALYREFRARQSPEEAIVALRDHLRIAQVYAYRTARDTYAAELGDEVTRLTGWLEDVRNRAMQPGRHGKYWQTGKFQGSLTFEVQRYFPNGQQTGSVECGNAGCAIKHAFAWLRQYPEGHALILANRPFPMVTVDANVTMARLIRLSWPAD